MVKLSDCIKITEITAQNAKVTLGSGKPAEILDAILKIPLDIYADAKSGWDENTYTVRKTESPAYFDHKDIRETKQVTTYKENLKEGIHKITLPFLHYQKEQPYHDQFIEGITLRNKADRPFDPDDSPVAIDDLFILKEDVQTLIQFINDTRPQKLIIANQAWKECFSWGVDVDDNQEKYFSQMEIAKKWLYKNWLGGKWGDRDVEIRETPLDQIASLICKDRTTTKIKKKIKVNSNENTPDHPLYALELDIANTCWMDLFGDSEVKEQKMKRGPKKFIEKWLSDNYSGLTNNKKELITLTVNPLPGGGNPKI